jgi:hypothetical protein
MRFASLLFVKGGVLLDKLLLVFRYVFEGVNRIGCARRNASTAIDAPVRINIHLRCSLEAGLILLRVDAIRWTHFYAQRILDAIVSNYIGHDESVSRTRERFRLTQKLL